MNTELLDAVQRQAAEIGPLLGERLVLPRSIRELTITRPGNTDALLDLVADDPEQNLPYWAELWPSGIALADAVLATPELVRGRSVLELGCGLGVTAIAVVASGCELLATDYSPESLTLSRLNCLRNTGAEPATLRVNWRHPDARFEERIGEAYPVVLAADVLYERRDIEPLLALVERLVAPGGMLWLAHPRRPPAQMFLETLRERGWDGPVESVTGPWPDSKDEHVVVDVHRLVRT
ncbi:MAG: class I SAM-dependent methyltransferase [Thermomicrobiales bacterium]